MPQQLQNLTMHFTIARILSTLEQHMSKLMRIVITTAYTGLERDMRFEKIVLHDSVRKAKER